MDNTTLNVSNTTDPIAIEAGGFRVYGNQPATLANENFDTLRFVNLSPNPAVDYFTINAPLSKVLIYSITGQLVKSFNDKLQNDVYQISDLNTGIYLVKAIDSNNNEKTMKLIKQ